MKDLGHAFSSTFTLKTVGERCEEEPNKQRGPGGLGQEELQQFLPGSLPSGFMEGSLPAASLELRS